MKKILVIAPASIPIIGAEAIVNAKLLEALSIDGRFEIDLISKVVKSGPYPDDFKLSESNIRLNRFYQVEVDNNVTIESIKGHISSYLKFKIVTKGSHWAVKALKIAESLVKENNYDYVLTKNYPSLLIGKYLKQKYNIKWIASWNDPFPTCKYPEPYGNGICAKTNLMEKRIIKLMETYPDLHIFPSERLRNYMSKFIRINIHDTLIIPHVAFHPDNNVIKNHETLRIIHSGNLTHPRNPEKFIKAIRMFLNKFDSAPIQVTFQGKLCDSDIKLIEMLNLNTNVKIVPPVSYAESIDALKYNDVAVVLEAECEEGIFLPTKVGDFMENKMSIFAISPSKGTLNDLYKAGNIPYFANNKKVEDICLSLEQIFKDFKSGNLKESIVEPTYLPEFVSNYYYRL